MASLHRLLHLLFLFLIPSAFAARGLGGSDGGKVNLLTPKAAALRYWSQKVPDGQPRPEFLVSKLSPLTVQNMAELQRLADGNALSTKLSAFCSWANLSCLPDVTEGQEKHAGPRLIRQVTDPSNNFDNGRENHPDPYFYGRENKEGLENQPNPYFYGRKNQPNPYFYSSENQEGQENQPNPYFYGRENHPNPYFYSRENHPNPYFYGQENKEGRENQPNPYFYGRENKEGRENKPNPYFYGRDNQPNPYYYGRENKEGRENQPNPYFYGRENKEGRENQPNPYFYSRENHPNPYFYGRENKEGRENQPNPYFYGRENKEDRENRPNPYFYSNKNHPNPYFYGRENKEGRENQPNPYFYGQENQPNPYFYSRKNKEGRENQQNPYFYNGENHPNLYSHRSAPSQASDHAGAHSSHYSLTTVEERMFFRESQLQEGKLVKMPDIKDKMPAHAFLPRSIADKLPFTSSGLSELLQVFKAGENPNFAYKMGESLRECEQEPSMGEIKRCVTSVEDMLDFAVDIVGPSATAKTTAGLGGSNATVQVGRVVKINGGHVSKSVSCHQKPFPYMVYSCHSVPSVRVYEVDLLHQSTKAPLNRAIAICHVDTSSWTPAHFSFGLLGGEPGKIEVCHWIFENDMAWVRAE